MAIDHLDLLALNAAPSDGPRGRSTDQVTTASGCGAKPEAVIPLGDGDLSDF